MGKTTFAKVLVSRERKLSLMAPASSSGPGLDRGDGLKKKDIGAPSLDSDRFGISDDLIGEVTNISVSTTDVSPPSGSHSQALAVDPMRYGSLTVDPRNRSPSYRPEVEFPEMQTRVEPDVPFLTDVDELAHAEGTEPC
ncbi:hypothetical protein BHM03_00001882 [Ensete ventricosum]|nr:hypothetical protein BHM03_00001882 [Ensete ventricosum]